MKVKKFSLAKFRNAEVISFCNNIINITSGYDWENLGAQSFRSDMIETTKDLEIQINRLSTVNETKSITNASSTFAAIFRMIRHFLKGYELSTIPEEKKAAKQIIDLFRAHNWDLHRENYKIQCVVAEVLLDDCQKEQLIKEAIETLNLGQFIDRMSESVKALDESIQVRKAKQINLKTDNNTKAIRDRIYQQLSALFNYLDAMSTISGYDDIKNMIRQINLSIGEIKTSILLRTYRINKP